MTKTNRNSFHLEIPPWPTLTMASFRYFKQNEKHVTRIFKEYVLIFMLKNTLYFTENKNEIVLNAGDWYIQLPNLKQEGNKGSPAPVYYYIHFQANGYHPADDNNSTLYNNMEEGRILLPIQGTFNIELFTAILEKLNSSLKQATNNFLKRQAIFLEILNKLIPETNALDSKTQKLAQQIITYLDLNYHNHLTYDDLAHKFNYSKDYLSLVFKKHYGITPKQYIEQKRLEKSKKLLLNTDLKQDLIAKEIGYNDLTVFYKAFYKQMGMAPGEWRLKTRGLDK